MLANAGFENSYGMRDVQDDYQDDDDDGWDDDDDEGTDDDAGVRAEPSAQSGRGRGGGISARSRRDRRLAPARNDE